MKVDLIKCGACQADISPLSESCTKCGNPNDWQHPVIKSFLRDPVLVDKTYNYISTKTTLRGVVSKKMSKPREISMLLIGAATFLFLGLYSTLIFLFLFFMVLVLPVKLKDDVYFEYNALSGNWKSNNDKLFEPVRQHFIKHSNTD